MSIQIVLLSLINKVHSSKHLSVVFKRANWSCQKSYNLFLEDIAPKTAHQLLCGCTSTVVHMSTSCYACVFQLMCGNKYPIKPMVKKILRLLVLPYFESLNVLFCKFTTNILRYQTFYFCFCSVVKFLAALADRKVVVQSFILPVTTIHRVLRCKGRDTFPGIILWCSYGRYSWTSWIGVDLGDDAVPKS